MADGLSVHFIHRNVAEDVCQAVQGGHDVLGTSVTPTFGRLLICFISLQGFCEQDLGLSFLWRLRSDWFRWEDGIFKAIVAFCPMADDFVIGDEGLDEFMGELIGQGERVRWAESPVFSRHDRVFPHGVIVLGHHQAFECFYDPFGVSRHILGMWAGWSEIVNGSMFVFFQETP